MDNLAVIFLIRATMYAKLLKKNKNIWNTYGGTITNDDNISSDNL